MRVSTAFSRLLRLECVWVRGVRSEPGTVIVRVALRRRRLVCPECSFSTPHCHDVRPVLSDWRLVRELERKASAMHRLSALAERLPNSALSPKTLRGRQRHLVR